MIRSEKGSVLSFCFSKCVLMLNFIVVCLWYFIGIVNYVVKYMKIKLRLMKLGICVLNYLIIKLFFVIFILILIDVIFCCIYVNNIFYLVNSIIIIY